MPFWALALLLIFLYPVMLRATKIVQLRDGGLEIQLASVCEVNEEMEYSPPRHL